MIQKEKDLKKTYQSLNCKKIVSLFGGLGALAMQTRSVAEYNIEEATGAPTNQPVVVH